MRRFFLIVVLGCVFASAGCSDMITHSGMTPPGEVVKPRAKPSNPYEALLAEYQGEYRRASVAASEADDTARASARENFVAKDAAFASKFYELARKQPNAPYAFDALAWVVGHTPPPDNGGALRILTKSHAADPRVASFCLALRGSPAHLTGAADAFLHAVIEKNEARDARGYATFLLAERLHFAYRALRTRDDAKGREEVAETSKTAVGLFKDVIEHFSDLPIEDLAASRTTTIGDIAGHDCFELRFLTVGKTAPEIKGKDFDAVELKLGDFLGQVVLLVFWSDEADDASLAFARELGTRLAARPFVILGVDGGADLEIVRDRLGSAGPNWKTFWDDGDPPPIRTEWNVDETTTTLFFLLDADGAIRNIRPAHDLKGLDVVIDKLVEATEKAAAPSNDD